MKHNKVWRALNNNVVIASQAASWARRCTTNVDAETCFREALEALAEYEQSRAMLKPSTKQK